MKWHQSLKMACVIAAITASTSQSSQAEILAGVDFQFGTSKVAPGFTGITATSAKSYSTTQNGITMSFAGTSTRPNTSRDRDGTIDALPLLDDFLQLAGTADHKPEAAITFSGLTPNTPYTFTFYSHNQGAFQLPHTFYAGTTAGSNLGTFRTNCNTAQTKLDPALAATSFNLTSDNSGAVLVTMAANDVSLTINGFSVSALTDTPASAVETFTYDNNPNGVQVFILAGQSNMVGFGKAEDGHGDVPGAIGSLRHLAVNQPAQYAHLLEDPAKPATSPWKTLYQIKVWWRDNEPTQPRAVIKGDLGIGYSQKRNKSWFGPEYGFGWVMSRHFTDKPVLIIKVAWSGKSLQTSFRPPSAVAARGGSIGPCYKGLVENVRDCLANLDTDFPEFTGMGYCIRGIGWHQGFPDRVKKEASDEYERNLVDFINDLRAEFNNPNLPFSITTTGMDPAPEYSTVELAQLAVGDPKKYPQFAGNVRVTDTRPFWRTAEVSPSNLGYHWNHNAESQYLNGTAMGTQMLEMIDQPR